MPESSKKAASAKRVNQTASKAKKTPSRPVTSKATAATSPKKSIVSKKSTVSERPTEIRSTKAALPPAGPSWFKTAGKNTVKTIRTIKFWYSVAGVIVTLVVALVLWWQWQRSYVAVVGGQYISTSVMDDQLRANYGTNGVTAVIQQQLVLQEGQRQHIKIADKDITTQINKIITSSGGATSYKNQLKQLGISEDLLKFQVQVQLTREALLKDKIQPTTQQIQDYYDQNKSTVDPDNKGLAAVKSSVSDAVKQQNLDSATPDYLDTLQQRTHTETDLSHLSLTFGDFLSQTIYPIPNEVWNFVSGKK